MEGQPDDVVYDRIWVAHVKVHKAFSVVSAVDNDSEWSLGPLLVPSNIHDESCKQLDLEDVTRPIFGCGVEVKISSDYSSAR